MDKISQVKVPCQGCKDRQPNQEAHMGFGGCLSFDPNDKAKES